MNKNIQILAVFVSLLAASAWITTLTFESSALAGATGGSSGGSRGGGGGGSPGGGGGAYRGGGGGLKIGGSSSGYSGTVAGGFGSLGGSRAATRGSTLGGSATFSGAKSLSLATTRSTSSIRTYGFSRGIITSGLPASPLKQTDINTRTFSARNPFVSFSRTSNSQISAGISGKSAPVMNSRVYSFSQTIRTTDSSTKKNAMVPSDSFLWNPNNPYYWLNAYYNPLHPLYYLYHPYTDSIGATTASYDSDIKVEHHIVQELSEDIGNKLTALCKDDVPSSLCERRGKDFLEANSIPQNRVERKRFYALFAFKTCVYPTKDSVDESSITCLQKAAVILPESDVQASFDICKSEKSEDDKDRQSNCVEKSVAALSAGFDPNVLNTEALAPQLEEFDPRLKSVILAGCHELGKNAAYDCSMRGLAMLASSPFPSDLGNQERYVSELAANLCVADPNSPTASSSERNCLWTAANNSGIKKLAEVIPYCINGVKAQYSIFTRSFHGDDIANDQNSCIHEAFDNIASGLNYDCLRPDSLAPETAKIDPLTANAIKVGCDALEPKSRYNCMKTATLWSEEHRTPKDLPNQEKILAKLFTSMCSEISGSDNDDELKNIAAREYTCFSVATQTAHLDKLHGIIGYCDSHFDGKDWDKKLACSTKAAIALSKGMNYSILDPESLAPQLAKLSAQESSVINAACESVSQQNRYDCVLKAFEASKQHQNKVYYNDVESRIAKEIESICQSPEDYAKYDACFHLASPKVENAEFSRKLSTCTGGDCYGAVLEFESRSIPFQEYEKLKDKNSEDQSSDETASDK